MDEAAVAKMTKDNGTAEDQTGTNISPKRRSIISPLLHNHPDCQGMETTQLSPITAGTNCSVPREQAEECPICSEPFQTHGEHIVATLHCNHTVCQRCVLAVQRMARDPSRLRCPLCRQTTPLPQWDMFSLQEGMYSSSVHLYEAGRPDPDLRPSSHLSCLRLMRIYSLYFYVTALILLLLLLAYLLYRGRTPLSV